MEAILAKITSVKNIVSIKGTQFKGSVSSHRSTLESKLKHFTDIKVTSQTVRNDMTVSQQHAHVQWKTKQRKEKDLKTIAKGRGRKLKCEEFPELTRYIEYCFGVLRGGGRPEADPRLLDTKLFKAADNATMMGHIKEIKHYEPEFVLSLLPVCILTRTIIRKALFKQNATTTERMLMQMCHSTKLQILQRRFTLLMAIGRQPT